MDERFALAQLHLSRSHLHVLEVRIFVNALRLSADSRDRATPRVSRERVKFNGMGTDGARLVDEGTSRAITSTGMARHGFAFSHQRKEAGEPVCGSKSARCE